MHIIRLRGPWQVEALARFVPHLDGTFSIADDNLPAAADRGVVPADWSADLGDGFLGRVRYRRAFNKPTGLNGGERVFLVIEPPRSAGVVQLNGERLGVVSCRPAVGRYDVTDLLEGFNQVEVLVEHPKLDDRGRAGDDCDLGVAGGMVGEVRLEIEE